MYKVKIKSLFLLFSDKAAPMTSMDGVLSNNPVRLIAEKIYLLLIASKTPPPRVAPRISKFLSHL